MLQVSDSVSNVSSGGSSTTTTPNTPNSSTTSSSSSTAPSSPGSPATSPPAVGNRHNVKRHSFTAVNTGHHAHPHHRHSAEILSPPVDSAPNNANNSGGNESFSSLQVRKPLFFSDNFCADSYICELLPRSMHNSLSLLHFNISLFLSWNTRWIWIKLNFLSILDER